MRIYFNIILLNILLIAVLIDVSFSSSYNTLFAQTLSILAGVPEVVLQQGISGTSTIYVNNTSARVNVSSPISFEY